jgi:hypothetical protein
LFTVTQKSLPLSKQERPETGNLCCISESVIFIYTGLRLEDKIALFLFCLPQESDYANKFSSQIIIVIEYPVVLVEH